MGRYCVIGAGAAGLSAIQALRETDREVVCFERGDRVGGHWNTDYDALHLITARDQTHFPDFPMPDHYPHFPSRDQVCAYIHSYADHHGLRDHIVFDTEVISVDPIEGDAAEAPGTSGWRVRTSRGDEGVFDAVLVANGHLWSPRIPEVAADFTGAQVHTGRYRNVGDLEGDRVLVVGAGNSGCDVAVDVAQSRREVDVVMRKGLHFQPKMYFGVPRQMVPFLSEFTPEEQDLVSRLLARVSIGENSAYPGLPMPESHDLAGGATTVNDLLLYWVHHGRIAIRPAIDSITQKRVRFADGAEKEYDSIIWATGFDVRVPFIPEGMLEWRSGAPVRHAGGILPVGAENLYFVGLIAPRGPQIPVYGEQMRLVLRMLALQEAAVEDAVDLTAYFSRVQEPWTGIDVVRHHWDRDMADTAAHLVALEDRYTVAGAVSGAAR